MNRPSPPPILPRRPQTASRVAPGRYAAVARGGSESDFPGHDSVQTASRCGTARKCRVSVFSVGALDGRRVSPVGGFAPRGKPRWLADGSRL